MDTKCSLIASWFSQTTFGGGRIDSHCDRTIARCKYNQDSVQQSSTDSYKTNKLKDLFQLSPAARQKASGRQSL